MSTIIFTEILTSDRSQDVIQRFQDHSPIKALLPLRFPSGHRLENLEGYCAGCRKPISPENLHGSGGFLIPTVVTLNTQGYCPDCQMVTETHYRFRVRNGAVFSEYRDSRGRWCSRCISPLPEPRRKSLLKSAWETLRLAFGLGR